MRKQLILEFQVLLDGPNEEKLPTLKVLVMLVGVVRKMPSREPLIHAIRLLQARDEPG